MSNLKRLRPQPGVTLSPIRTGAASWAMTLEGVLHRVTFHHPLTWEDTRAMVRTLTDPDPKRRRAAVLEYREKSRAIKAEKCL